jgi:small subunit ribosomal protein S15
MAKKIMSESTKDIKEFQLHDKDTGSSDVQIALLTERIKHLTAHLATNKKDFASTRGLLMLVARRRKLLDYIASKNNDRYKNLLEKLGLRR